MGIFGLLTKKDLKIAILEDRLKRRREKAISMRDPTLAKIFNWQIEGQDPSIRHPYEQVPIIYGCVRARATNLAQVPMDVLRGEQEITAGPAVDLLREPNANMDYAQLVEGIVTCLDLRGNAFLLMDEQTRAGWPLFLHLVNPDNIEPAHDKVTGAFVGYWLAKKNQDKQFIEAARVIHWKYFNLRDDLLGFSPLDVAKLTYETEWDAIRYNRNFFKNDATPGLAYTHPQRLPDVLKEQLERKYIEKRRGVENAHGAVLLEGGLDVKVVGLSQEDIQFLEQRKFNREEICMIYKVPKAEVELYEDMNYATAQSADRSFWKKTLVPLGRLIQGGLNRSLFVPHGLACRFDFQAIDALNSEMLERVEAAEKLVNIGYPLNMVNRRLNLGFDEVEWGDEPRQMPTSLALLDASRGERKQALPAGAQPDPLHILDKAMLDKRWHELMEPLLPVVSAASRRLRKYYHDVKQRIMDRYAKHVGPASWVVNKEIEWREIDERTIREAFKNDKLQEAIEQYMRQAIGLGIASVPEALSSPFRIDSPAARELLRSKLIKVLECNQTGAETVIERLRTTLDEAIAEGLGNEQIAERIFSALGESMQNLETRARTIARTEVNGSFSQARYQAITETQPKGLRWISSRDEKVRDTHRDLDGKMIRFGKSFQTSRGNQVRYPLDPEAPAEETINCRCVMEPIYFDEEIEE